MWRGRPREPPLLPDTGEATPELLDRLSAERDRIDSRIGDLVNARDRLGTVMAAAVNR
ncbi:hypothetical protein AB0P45_32430 [Streptomyces niveus]|uniref:hypothetical protein n=1 Tax=Streptomyces niveus TaxID=193462 RepID=UPI00341DE96F